MQTRPRRSLSVARRLLDSAEQLGSTCNLQPDEHTYKSILRGISRHWLYPNTVEGMFERLKRFSRPSVDAYDALIATWSKSRDPKAPRRVQELLAELWSVYNSCPKETASKLLPTWSSRSNECDGERTRQGQTGGTTC
jgi:hypothetical protein